MDWAVSRVRSTRPSRSAYLQALSSRMAVSCPSCPASPVTVMPGATRLSNVSPCSYATDSKGSRRLITTSLRSKGSIAGVWAVSALARKSSSSTKVFIRPASSLVFSTHCRWALMVSSRWESRMPVLARMTVRGVLSSWEASATNCRCRSQARSTGRSAQAERNRLMTKNAVSPPIPTSSEVSSSRCMVDLPLLRSTKAKVVPAGVSSLKNRSPSPESTPVLPPCAKARETACAASSSVTLTVSP